LEMRQYCKIQGNAVFRAAAGISFIRRPESPEGPCDVTPVTCAQSESLVEFGASWRREKKKCQKKNPSLNIYISYIIYILYFVVPNSTRLDHVTRIEKQHSWLTWGLVELQSDLDEHILFVDGILNLLDLLAIGDPMG
jgi:hypothetical protein